MKTSERLRRAKNRLVGDGWSPHACDAEKREKRVGLWQPGVFTPFVWCEPTDEVAERFSILGALRADAGDVEEAVKLLCLLQNLPVVRLAATSGLEHRLLAAGLNAWECQPERTTSDVQQLLSAAIARAVAIERGRGNR